MVPLIFSSHLEHNCKARRMLSCALHVQTMDPARQLDYSFDPLDPTKAGSHQLLCSLAMTLQEQNMPLRSQISHCIPQGSFPPYALLSYSPS